MAMVGRERERDELQRYCESTRPEFIVVYGRRRVGKTFLVREYFNYTFAFYATGTVGGNMHDQLRAFHGFLHENGDSHIDVPTDWLEAFSRLRALLEGDKVRRDPACGKRVVFIDEMPWLDTPRSNFKQALDLFWNGWASTQKDLLLIVCGSATSWIIRNLLRSRGGLHNRITGRLHLRPFTLAECEKYYDINGITFSRQEMVEGYMVFGGIPFYLDLIDRRLSLSQNVDRICFAPDGALREEFDELYRSLFKNAERHIAIVRALNQRKAGCSRKEIIEKSGMGAGGTLSKALEELEQCGFIRRYRDFTKRERDAIYQLIDPFTLFYLRFMEGRLEGEGAWEAYLGTPGYHAWSGLAFEMTCLLHERQLKQALGIQAIASSTSAWRSSAPGSKAQIDLLIDRADGVVNACEMKYSQAPFVIGKALDAELRGRIADFRAETGTKKAVRLTMVCPYGVRRNKYWGAVQNEITFEDLFRP